MKRINEKQFREFCEEVKEPTWVISQRRSSFLKIKESLMPRFRYGLNIAIKPKDFDFSSVVPRRTIEGLKSVIKYNEYSGIKVYSGSSIADFGEDAEYFRKFFIDDRKSTNLLHNFHNAFANSFVLIIVPCNVAVDSSVELYFDIEEGPLISNIFVLADKNAKTKIFIHKDSNNADYVSESIKVLAEEGSSVDIVTVQNLDKKAVNMQRRSSLGARNSSVKWTDLCIGSSYTKSEIVSSLDGEGSDTDNIVLFLGNKEQRYDIYTASLHNAENTSSNIVTKGVLNGKAKALSRGLISIGRNAYGSNGYEKQDVLLLSKDSEADAIPNLEINNPEVKCSHGSTVGRIDAEKIFYLMSRGLSIDEAKQKIIEGYFAPVIEHINEIHAKEKIHSYIISSLK